MDACQLRVRARVPGPGRSRSDGEAFTGGGPIGIAAELYNRGWRRHGEEPAPASELEPTLDSGGGCANGGALDPLLDGCRDPAWPCRSSAMYSNNSKDPSMTKGV